MTCILWTYIQHTFTAVPPFLAFPLESSPPSVPADQMKNIQRPTGHIRHVWARVLQAGSKKYLLFPSIFLHPQFYFLQQRPSPRPYHLQFFLLWAYLAASNLDLPRLIQLKCTNKTLIITHQHRNNKPYNVWLKAYKRTWSRTWKLFTMTTILPTLSSWWEATAAERRREFAPTVWLSCFAVDATGTRNNSGWPPGCPW